VAKCVINLYKGGATRIGKYLRDKSYDNNRNPGKAVFFSEAKKKAVNCTSLVKLLSMGFVILVKTH